MCVPNQVILPSSMFKIKVRHIINSRLKRDLMSQNTFNSNTYRLSHVLHNYAFHSLDFTKVENSPGYV